MQIHSTHKILKSSLLLLFSLGMVTTAVYLFEHPKLPTTSTAYPVSQQAIDCSKAPSGKLASIQKQAATPNKCLFIGCSGFFQ